MGISVLKSRREYFGGGVWGVKIKFQLWCHQYMVAGGGIASVKNPGTKVLCSGREAQCNSGGGWNN